jgi:Domain of unknown function (DUF1844)
MAQNRNEGFTVTDRRLFTAEGELRSDVAEEQETPKEQPAATAQKPAAPIPELAPEKDKVAPPTPTDAERKQQADAYRQSSQEMDREVEASGHSAKELEITFERFLASLYMTGMVQLGLMHEQGGQPQLDLIGARQTIDTLGMLSGKTKNNLTAKEENFLQNALYELRMAYVEVTNAIARGPEQVSAAK